MFGLLALLLVVAPPHFRAATGWHVGSRSCTGISPYRCAQASGWASTVRYRDCGNCVPPHRTLAHLPPGGIVIQVSNTQGHFGYEKWPPRIRARDVTAGFEGVPDRYGVFQRLVRTGSLDHSLFVWFGRAHPTRRQLARANAELLTVR
ncbi:MAG TPA: hypothetical protein VJQ07_09125 [Gaiellaceae bacterium]|jgi:hypothetical protein|nr:hypothetical protein [Gaiellaceae bacterium]